MKYSHLFIVGLPRTGTKLVQNILQKSPFTHYCISPETHFLGHFIRPGIKKEIRRLGGLLHDYNVHKFVDLMYSTRLRGTYWNMLRDGRLGVRKEAFLREILNSSRTERDIYDILLRIHVNASDNVVYGDKTPSHLYHVPKLVEWYPESKIIHTFRDPRAIIVSEWKKRLQNRINTTFSNKLAQFYAFEVVLHVTMTWLCAARLHHKYTKRYSTNYCLIKFEDLVIEPEKTIKNLCKFLDEKFHKNMMNPRKFDSSYLIDKGFGIDKETLNRWKKHIRPWMEAWISIWGRKYMKEFGYTKD